MEELLPDKWNESPSVFFVRQVVLCKVLGQKRLFLPQF